MQRKIRFTDEAGDEVGVAIISNPGLATRVFQMLEEVALERGLGMELETSKGNVLASNYYDPKEVNGG